MNDANLHKPIDTLLLPAPATDDKDAQKVNTGFSVKLDNLGPMVVNSDGTLSRIANWSNMTRAEQERTIRVLSARNKNRMDNEEEKLRKQDEALDQVANLT